MYVRVSTAEQVEHGYSLDGQRRRLREHAEREGWRVVEEVSDEGYSGADPWRPGLRRVRELAEAGEIDAVVGAYMDRFFRDEYYHLAFARDLDGLGVRMVALNSTGNMIGDSVMRGYAAYERHQIRERLHNGIDDMVRDRGEVKATYKAPYGYRRAGEKGEKLAAFEPEIEAVRKMYALAAEGKSLEAIRKALNDAGVPSPGDSANGWHRSTVRRFLGNDLYAPHTAEEVAAKVSAPVAANLDPDAAYGLWGWKRSRTAARWKEWDEEKGKYVTHVRREARPVEEHSFVPVPDAGIPPEVVERARKTLSARYKGQTTGKYVDSRFYELRGIARCGSCGAVLSSHNAGGGNFYYRCKGRYQNAASVCESHRSFRADDLERAVLEAMSQFLDKRSYFVEKFEQHAAKKRRELRDRADAANARTLHEELQGKQTERRGRLRQNARGVLPDEELDGELEELDADIARLREYLLAAETFEADRKALEAYLRHTREMLEGASYEWFNSQATGQDRAEMYRRLELTAQANDDGRLVLRGLFGDCFGDLAHTQTSTSRSR